MEKKEILLFFDGVQLFTSCRIHIHIHTLTEESLVRSFDERPLSKFMTRERSVALLGPKCALHPYVCTFLSLSLSLSICLSLYRCVDGNQGAESSWQCTSLSTPDKRASSIIHKTDSWRDQSLVSSIGDQLSDSRRVWKCQ